MSEKKYHAVVLDRTGRLVAGMGYVRQGCTPEGVLVEAEALHVVIKFGGVLSRISISQCDDAIWYDLTKLDAELCSQGLHLGLVDPDTFLEQSSVVLAKALSALQAAKLDG